MTDRVHSLTVVLEKDIRVDDVEPLIQAIAQMRGVLTVSGIVSNADSWMAERRARSMLTRKLFDVLREEL